MIRGHDEAGKGKSKDGEETGIRPQQQQFPSSLVVGFSE